MTTNNNNNNDVIRAVIVAEGDSHEEVLTFASRELCDAYAEGLSKGAELYGAGSCGLFREDQLPELDRGDKYDRKAAAMVRAKLRQQEG